MNVKSAQPFGRRGRPPARVASRPAEPRAAKSPDAESRLAELPPDLVAAVLGPAAPSGDAHANSTGAKPVVIKVARSLRAAVLAGLCVGFFNASINVAKSAGIGKELAPLLGHSVLPLPAIAIFVGLWSAARTTALSLLVTHRVLTQLGRTGFLAYAFGGGIVAVAYALCVHALAPEWSHHALGLEFLTGLGAGFFYRLFAGTVPAGRG